MKTLYEGILADIEDTLKTGDKTAKKLHSAGNKLELLGVIGDETPLMNILGPKLEKHITGLEPNDSKKIYAAIDKYNLYYCSNNTLSNSMKNKIYSLITYIENFELDNTNTDFDDKKIKDKFCKDLTNDLKSKGIIYNAVFHNEAAKASGGDMKGLFMLALQVGQVKPYDFIMLFKINK